MTVREVAVTMGARRTWVSAWLRGMGCEVTRFGVRRREAEEALAWWLSARGAAVLSGRAKWNIVTGHRRQHGAE